MKRFFVCLLIFFCSCARHGVKVNMAPIDVSTFRGLAYVVVGNVSGQPKWASHVSVVVKVPDGLRLDVMENITDVVATLAVRDNQGQLRLTLENKTYPLKDGYIRLPKIGEVGVTANELAAILIGRPIVPQGAALRQAQGAALRQAQGAVRVSEPFHTERGSYFVKGLSSEVEMSASEKSALVYTKFSSPEKKRILYEANFDDFANIGGKKFPKHIIIRFEHPKLIMDIHYKDIRTDINVPWGLIKSDEK